MLLFKIEKRLKMKNIEWKKLIVLLIIIVAVIGIVVLIANLLNKDGDVPTNEQKTSAEKLTINNICNLTKGYGTMYDGIDVLFSHDKVTYEDLSVSNVLNAAVRYAKDNLDTEISPATIYQIEKATPYRSSVYEFYTGEIIRQAIKELFGVDFENKTSRPEFNYGYSFIYISEFDVYLMTTNEYYKEKDENYGIAYHIISTTKDKKTNNLKTEIAVAFTVINDSKKLFLKEPDADKAVYESNTEDSEIEESKINEFNHYTITLKDMDGKHVFDSIEKN